MDDGRTSGRKAATGSGGAEGTPAPPDSDSEQTIDSAASPPPGPPRSVAPPTNADALETLARPVAAPESVDPDATCLLPAAGTPTDSDATIDVAARGGEGPSLVLRDSAVGGATVPPVTAGRIPGQPWVEGYVIEGELGRGGMGVVYKARQPKLRRTVAIKMIRAAGLASEEHVARFYAEARAVAALQHVNIVQIHDIGESETLPYFSLEFVPGSSLDKKLAKQPQPPEDSAAMIETLARAMHYAHLHGIVHRDLKPANILLTEEGVPKITDFGLAKDTGEDSGMSRDGQAMGTPSYMPPEQARGDLALLGPRADVYALGAILYEMLVGRPPFLGANAYDTLLQVLKKDPIAPSQLVPRLPKDVETICLKCLEKDPAKRYASAQDLADDCHRYVLGEPILSRPISAPERTWRWCKRNPRMAALIAAVAGLLVTVAVGSSVAAMVILAERDEKEIQRKAAVKAQGLAEAHEAVAKENEKVAGEQSALALGALQTFVDTVQERLDDAPRTRKLKEELLDMTIDTLDRVSKKAEQTTSIDATILNANFKYADMYRSFGEMEKAIERFEKCLELAEADAASKLSAGVDNDRSQLNLAAVEAMLGELVATQRHHPRAGLARCNRALEVAERLSAKPRSVEGKISAEELSALLDEVRMKIAFINYAQGDPAASAPFFRLALDARRAAVAADPADPAAKVELARSLKGVGETAFLLGERNEGFRLYEESISILNELLTDFRGNVQLEALLAITEGDYADLHLRERSFDLARPHYDDAIDILEGLTKADAENQEVARQLALAEYRRGQLSRAEGLDAEATAHFQRSLDARRKLSDGSPNDVALRMELMLAMAQCGEESEAARIAATLPTEHGDRELLLAIAKCFAIAARDTEGDERQAAIDRAIATLEKAIAAGYRDAVILRTDPDLAPLRDDPRYPQLEIPTTAPAA